jgi:hypothetical protein
MARQFRELEKENQRLKKLLAEQALATPTQWIVALSHRAPRRSVFQLYSGGIAILRVDHSFRVLAAKACKKWKPRILNI